MNKNDVIKHSNKHYNTHWPAYEFALFYFPGNKTVDVGYVLPSPIQKALLE